MPEDETEIQTPWKRATQQRYALQETRTAREQGGRQQPNSGRRWFAKRDVVLENPIGRLLIDNKETGQNDSYRITGKDFKALKRDANRTPPGCYPGLQIDIRGVHLMVTETVFYDDVKKHIAGLEARIEELQEKLDAREKDLP
jgi:hypothetical protein